HLPSSQFIVSILIKPSRLLLFNKNLTASLFSPSWFATNSRISKFCSYNQVMTDNISKATSTTNPAIQTVINDVVKSPEDKHSYRALVLSNGIRVMLVSDSEADRSAASLCVLAGSINEPKSWQGLAHFCEHMLFLGTEKYPVEDSYSNFINEHGGMNNAYTAEDHTCYFFDIAPKHLAEALDRFSQFFLCPLFTPSATEREVQAVHSEHSKNIPQDVWRMQQLEHTLANPEHDYGDHFFTGSLETLLPDSSKAGELREQLLKFHAEEYSANRLHLAVLGCESLDELQSMVVSTFASVPNKNLPVRRWDKHPYDGSECGVKVYAVTIKDVRTLQLVFPMPELRYHYKGAPDRYLSHLIGHEAPGSILAYLKRKGWSNALSAGCGGGSLGYDFFKVSLDLTEEGARREDAVIATLFRYIDMLRREGPQEWIYNEERDLEYMSFRFRDKSQPIDLTERLSAKMLYYPQRDALAAKVVLSEYMPDKITELLNLMTPDRCKVYIGSQSVKDKCTRTEPYYGVQYGVEKFSPELLAACRGDYQQLATADSFWPNGELPDSELHLPSPNPFIPTDFSLKSATDQHRDSPPPASAGPLILRSDRRGRLWHRLDYDYALPKACYTIELISPCAYTDSYAAVCSNLYFQLLSDALNALTYDAELAGLNYRIDPTENGAVLHCSGYNDKLPVLLNSVLQKMTKPDFNPVRFASLYDHMERSLKNFKLEQPYQHCSFHMNLICKTLVWTPDDQLDALANVTLDSVLQFSRQMQSRLYTETLVYGNVAATEAEPIADSVLASLTATPVPRSEIARARDFLLPAGTHHLYRSVHSHHKDSACAVYFQIESDAAGGFDAKIRSRVLCRLLGQVVQESYFDSLRTKQQLGYLVGVRTSAGVNTDGLIFFVQSDRHPVYLEERIDAFIDSIADDLKSMPDEQFQSHVAALNSVITEKPKKMTARNQLYFEEIRRGTLCFDRKERLSACLTKITKDDLLQHVNTWLSKDSKQRRRLSLHVVSEETHGGIKDADYANYTGVNIPSVQEFQRRLLLGRCQRRPLRSRGFCPHLRLPLPRLLNSEISLWLPGLILVFLTI
ncbi:hypothetical protein BOX15_Mlig002690g1, partial [Macrostomum lignano]